MSAKSSVRLPMLHRLHNPTASNHPHIQDIIWVSLHFAGLLPHAFGHEPDLIELAGQCSPHEYTLYKL